MSRVKRGVVSHKRHKRLLKQTKGFWGQRGNIFRRAKETLMRAMRFAYIGRRLKKRDFRSLFITRISAACKERGTSYSVFINNLKIAKVLINRKMLSQLAIVEPQAFTQLLTLVAKK
jgi:large subunit ribosomal protein L20